jgi:hypothetical protein
MRKTPLSESSSAIPCQNGLTVDQVVSLFQGGGTVLVEAYRRFAAGDLTHGNTATRKTPVAEGECNNFERRVKEA